MRYIGVKLILLAAGLALLSPGARAAAQTAQPPAQPAPVQELPPSVAPAKPQPEPAPAPIYDSRRFVRRMSGTETCLLCHSSYNFIVQKEGGAQHSLWIDGEMFQQSVHASLGCQACHTNIDAYGHRLKTHAQAVSKSAAEGLSGQQKADAAGHVEPTADELSLGRDFTLTVALAACVQCHPHEYEAYATSVHGEARLSGKNTDAPFCTDCHGMHYVLPKTNDRSRTNPANIPSTCLKCHDQTNIKARAGLVSNVGKSFEESFHGKRGMLGGVDVAVCNTCHGTHDIYRPTDPRSMINRERIAKTCGKCHDGAQLSFASAFTHQSVSKTEQTGLYILKQVYKWAIFLLIAQFILFALLDIYQYWRRRLASRKQGKLAADTTPAATEQATEPGTPAPVKDRRGKRPRVYERFHLHHRIQHFIMAFSFTALVLTGWPLRFPELRVSQLASAIFGGVGVIGIIHRFFGIMLVLVSIYHIIFLVGSFVRRKRSVAMLPSIVDLKEALGDVQYWFGLRASRPRFGRYNWIEKMEYFAVVWGTAVMIVSGIVIWLPTVATRYLPSWVVSASVIFHGYEALLAGLAIFLWHFYWVHLQPEVYPMSTVWLTGDMTEDEMEHHHPRELDALRAQERKAAAVEAKKQGERK